MKKLTRAELKEKALDELELYGDRNWNYYKQAIKSSRISTKKLQKIFITFIGREVYDALECVVDKDYEKLDRYFYTSVFDV